MYFFFFLTTQHRTCIMYTAQRWYVLRIVLIVDSLQFPNVQVSNTLQMLQFCLNLCFFLHKNLLFTHNSDKTGTAGSSFYVTWYIQVPKTTAFRGELVPFLDGQFAVWKSPLAHDILPVTTCVTQSRNSLFKSLNSKGVEKIKWQKQVNIKSDCNLHTKEYYRHNYSFKNIYHLRRQTTKENTHPDIKNDLMHKWIAHH